MSTECEAGVYTCTCAYIRKEPFLTISSSVSLPLSSPRFLLPLLPPLPLSLPGPLPHSLSLSGPVPSSIPAAEKHKQWEQLEAQP